MLPLKMMEIETPIGPMMAIGDENSLYFLDFTDRKKFDSQVEKLRLKIKREIIPGTAPSLRSIEKELKLYFEGKLKVFKTPVFTLGSPFQILVWNELSRIPFGETRSYIDVARKLKRPTHFRAVAMANSTNRCAVIIPCHRVINENGKLGGYASGLDRKKWLLAHEKKFGIK